MSWQYLKSWQVALTYAGTVIGAGFASGQELLLFFASYGTLGLFGIILAGFLFMYLGNRILDIAFYIQAIGYHQIFQAVCGKRLGHFYSSLSALFLLTSLAIMLAGAGAIGSEYFDWPPYQGILLLALALFVTTLFGATALMMVNCLLTPLFIIMILFVGILSLLYHGIHPALLSVTPTVAIQPTPHWALSSVLYVAYNMILASTILAPLGAKTPNPKVRQTGSLLGGLLLTLVACFIILIIMLHYPEAFTTQVPMLYIASAQHPYSYGAYVVILLAAMYTTGLASLYGCSVYLSSSWPISARKSALSILFICLICSQVGFSALITAAFPIFGLATLWFIIRLVCYGHLNN
ncbi:putative membrane protein YkvI [Sporomusaceae bacterium BoRhaA]|uniref:YkvI family membrane protein n=1 Tax=Pelorhabdus rhamnosifermentans TaxID=2772457 RepID=UPI001C0608A2|nr:hypothetical protein [Pelorhabdus rhamnosifermentans]MBU2702048.1 putative membrane protein YkvI [Pelorhabdus rhamnosifermentans]